MQTDTSAVVEILRQCADVLEHAGYDSKKREPIFCLDWIRDTLAKHGPKVSGGSSKWAVIEKLREIATREESR